ncbi:peptidase, M50 family protein [Calothrix sp. NIES-2100]|uniref:tetratricopeptide repeat protein n=1 Tax=Calothrix sp. NIES-2100 TaxID=1954172 RepID=UPI000B5DF323|nr:peptidase, M50 family protein [Calothrix sp. NIES-2100]
MMWLVALFICFGWMLSLCLHEFGHAIVAYWGGDTSVKDKGYLTLNPLKYSDQNLSLVMPIFFLLIGGIALPGGAVYINHNRLRNRFWQSAVSAAGPIADIILACLLSLLLISAGDYVYIVNRDSSFFYLIAALAYVISLNIYVVLINLLPIPGLDGYGIIEPWLPQAIQQQFNKIAKYGVWVLIGLLWFVRPFNLFLWNLADTISDFLHIPTYLTLVASEIFREYSRYLVFGLVLLLWIFRDKNKLLQKQAAQLIDAKKYEQAIACYDKIIKNQPKNADAWYGRGYALNYLHKHEEAIAAYDQTIQIQPDNNDAWYLRGYSLYSLQRYIEALAAYDKALEIKFDQPEIWFDKGMVLQDLERYEEAIAAYDRVIQLNANHTKAWNYKGISLMNLQQYEEALAIYEQAIIINPEDPYYWYNQACCYALQNNVILATEKLQQAIKLDPENIRQLVKTDHDFDGIREHELFQSLVID